MPTTTKPSPTAWRTVTDSKVQYVPVGTYTNRDGEECTRFARVGVRINMADGSHWFYASRFDSYTHHWLGCDHTPDWETEPRVAERKQTFTAKQLMAEYSQRPALLAALATAIDDAELADAEKRSG